jgi:hypothetical protein
MARCTMARRATSHEHIFPSAFIFFISSCSNSFLLTSRSRIVRATAKSEPPQLSYNSTFDSSSNRVVLSCYYSPQTSPINTRRSSFKSNLSSRVHANSNFQCRMPSPNRRPLYHPARTSDLHPYPEDQDPSLTQRGKSTPSLLPSPSPFSSCPYNIASTLRCCC